MKKWLLSICSFTFALLLINDLQRKIALSLYGSNMALAALKPLLMIINSLTVYLIF
jgi:hypothetical protein